MIFEKIIEIAKYYDWESIFRGSLYLSCPEGLKRYNLDTNYSELIYECDYFRGDDSIEKNIEGKRANIRGPHITNDGKYISFFIGGKKGCVFIRFNTETFEAEEVFRKGFRKPFCYANHLMICPENKDLFFYSHEGETFYISNRLWLYDAVTGKDRNIAKQRMDKGGNVGDCFGHEMWAPDGKGLYFVKYPSSTIKPCGICYVDIESGEYELLYSKYKYWHVGAEASGRFLTADTQYAPFQSEIVVIDRESGEEFVVDMPYMTAVHPCHPHPQLSPECNKVIYNALDENGRTCVKVACLSM